MVDEVRVVESWCTMSRLDHLYWDEAWEQSSNPNTRKTKTKGNKPKDIRMPLVPDCTHWRQSFKLEEGLTVFASAWMDHPNRGLGGGGFEGDPDVGFYLDTRWASDRLMVSPGTTGQFSRGCSSKTRMLLYPWPDYGMPKDRKCLMRSLSWLLKQVEQEKIVEIGCMGGHGRTGTALAALLVLQGIPAQDAIRRVWRRYCEEAIESKSQLAFIGALNH